MWIIEVENQTRALNRLKRFLNFIGITLPQGNDNKGMTSKNIAWLNSLPMLTPAGKASLNRLINDYKKHRAKVFEVTKELRAFVELSNPDAYKQIMTVLGIGSITAIALITEIGGFKRFGTPQQYCSYLGMIPWEHSSRDTIKTKGMQPRCNKQLRPMLIESAWTAIRRDAGLLLYYKEHAGKNNKHAIVKVACKLALIARGVVIKNHPYDSDYNLRNIKNVTEKKAGS